MTQGLALVNIGGLTASTILALLLLPVYYKLMSLKSDDEKRQRRKEKAERKLERSKKQWKGLMKRFLPKKGSDNQDETLFVLLGWNYNDNPVIGELPEVDLNRIEEMNPDQDLETAIANNYTLQINKRQLENSRNQTTKESLQTAISNNERQIGASLSSAYQSVRSARTSYEQAQVQASLEEENTRVAALQLAAGMITQSAYEEQVNTMNNSQYSAQSAGLDLLIAMENYDWAVAGLADAE